MNQNAHIVWGGVSDSQWGSQYHQQDRVYLMQDLALCLPAQIPRGSYLYLIGEKDDSDNSSDAR